MHRNAWSKTSWMSPTLLSELLAPDPPLCSETVYDRFLSSELRQQSCLLFLEQLELQAEAAVLLHLCSQGMQTTLAKGQAALITKAAGSIQYSGRLNVSDRLKLNYFWKCNDWYREQVTSILTYCIYTVLWLFKSEPTICLLLFYFTAVPSNQRQHLSWLWWVQRCGSSVPWPWLLAPAPESQISSPSAGTGRGSPWLSAALQSSDHKPLLPIEANGWWGTWMRCWRAWAAPDLKSSSMSHSISDRKHVRVHLKNSNLSRFPAFLWKKYIVLRLSQWSKVGDSKVENCARGSNQD